MFLQMEGFYPLLWQTNIPFCMYVCVCMCVYIYIYIALCVCLYGITDSMDMNLSKLWEMGRGRGAWHTAVHGVAKSLTQFGDWTTTVYINTHFLYPLSCWWKQVLPCLGYHKWCYYEHWGACIFFELEWLSLKSLQITNVDEEVENLCILLMRMQIGAATLETSMLLLLLLLLSRFSRVWPCVTP